MINRLVDSLFPPRVLTSLTVAMYTLVACQGVVAVAGGGSVHAVLGTVTAIAAALAGVHAWFGRGASEIVYAAVVILALFCGLVWEIVTREAGVGANAWNELTVGALEAAIAQRIFYVSHRS